MLSHFSRKVLKKKGTDLLSQIAGRLAYRPDFTPEEISIFESVESFTMTSPERIVGLIDAINYIVKNKIPGSFMECGVWRGGSMMTVAKVLGSVRDTSRELYLFDTFEGMTEPTLKDRVYSGQLAADILRGKHPLRRKNRRAIASFEDVERNMQSTGYPMKNVYLVRGRVEETIPDAAPSEICLLRLDTDWYESTRHELFHLYDRVVSGGVLIIDDYGHWAGAREAVDEFFSTLSYKPLFQRIDYTGRCCIKP